MNPDLLRLMAWLSPAFPVGGYAWSSGLESACLGGKVDTDTDLRTWIMTSISHGTLHNDSVLLAEAHRAPCNIEEINSTCLALAGSACRFNETTAMGKAFAKAASPWRSSDAPLLPALIAYPVAVGVIATENNVRLTDTIMMFLHSVVSNQIQAALRLMPLGQQTGVELLHSMETIICKKAAAIAGGSMGDLGGVAVNMEIAAMGHETLHSRTFRS